MSIQLRNDELVDILRPDFVGNDGTASPTFVDEYLTGSHRASVSVGVRVYRNVDFVHNNTGNWLIVDWTHQRWDDPDDDQWAIAPNPTRLTCQYVICANIRWAANAVGIRGMQIYLNGATIIGYSLPDAGSVTFTAQAITTTYKLVAGNFVELRAFQNSGGNLNVEAQLNYSPEFSMVRVA